MLRTSTAAGRAGTPRGGELQLRTQVNLLVEADGHRRPLVDWGHPHVLGWYRCLNLIAR